MSRPKNSEALSAMNLFERQCYHWGWADNEERIIKLLESQLGAYESRSVTMDDGLKCAIALIKGEQK